MTTWLGIDPGLAIVGWAILRDNSELMPILVDYGTIETSKNLSTAQRLIEIERDLKELIAEYKPGEIAVEMPFFNRQIKAAGGVLQALGIINLVSCRDGGIEPISSIKLVGNVISAMVGPLKRRWPNKLSIYSD